MTTPLRLFRVLAMVIFAIVANALPLKKIVGGTKAAPGEFPYMVSLRGVFFGHFCGGAIVGPRHIVTAAHCLETIEPDVYSDFYVATGSVFSDDGTNHVFSNVITHPDYDTESDDSVHDIAVIVLDADIEFDKNQASLGLPTELVPEGVLANLTGWGHPDNQTEIIASELMKINVKTLRADACNSSFAGLTDIRSSQICTFGGSGVGACRYDSGGPLVYKGQLIGVLAYGLPCARGIPDVFTSVYHHVDWIKKTMEEYSNQQAQIRDSKRQ